MILKKVNDLTRKPGLKFDDNFSVITGSHHGGGPGDDNTSSGGFDAANTNDVKFPPGRVGVSSFNSNLATKNRFAPRKVIH
jgi:hypothetical protein